MHARNRYAEIMWRYLVVSILKVKLPLRHTGRWARLGWVWNRRRGHRTRRGIWNSCASNLDLYAVGITRDHQADDRVAWFRGPIHDTVIISNVFFALLNSFCGNVPDFGNEHDNDGVLWKLTLEGIFCFSISRQSWSIQCICIALELLIKRTQSMSYSIGARQLRAASVQSLICLHGNLKNKSLPSFFEVFSSLGTSHTAIKGSNQAGNMC